MKDKLLYFPSINVPSSSWFYSSFLYYDKIATIIPKSIIQREVESKISLDPTLSKDTLDLINTDYYEYLTELDDYDNRRLNKRLQSILSRAEGMLESLKNELSIGSVYRIHNEKFSSQFMSELRSLGLAKPVDYEWHHVSYSVGQAMMYKLAEIIGELENYTPSTDLHEFTYSVVAEHNEVIEKQVFTNYLVHKIFPIPENIEVKRLTEFKSTYARELRDFRVLIEARANQYLKNDNEQKLLFIEDELEFIESEKKKLTTMLEDAGFGRITFSDFYTFGKVVAYSILQKPIGVLRNLWRLGKGKPNPIKGNIYAYPALYNYNFGGKK